MKKKTIVFVISYISIIQPMDLDLLKSITTNIEGITFTEFISSEPPKFDPQVRVIAFASFLGLQPIGQLVTNSNEQKKIKKIPIQKGKNEKYKPQKPFVCKGIDCIRSFSSMNRLKNHFKLEHPGLLKLIDSHYRQLRPYRCPKCKRAFNENSHLTDHIKNIHFNSTSFFCAYCYKTYRHSCSRNVHQRKCKDR